jgi:hypothetical protein
MKSHASNTVPVPLGDGLIRVYFNSRDEDNRSYVSWVEINVDGEDFEIIRECDSPVLSPGSPGYFDESGVSIGCITNIDGEKRLYYIGWTLGKTVPWYNSIGFAILSENGDVAEKYSRAPIYSRTEEDPITLSYPFLINSGGSYFVYYGSSKSWGREKNSMNHVMKLAKSEDGITFDPLGIEVIPPRDKAEYAFSRPYVYVDEHGLWRMYYSFRGENYRIGYAESNDGIEWERKDSEAGISVSETDGNWDSEMVCYGYLFFNDGRTYMTYNGNGYGKTGFGLAILESN